eukprot:TRINITY_DN12332_c0_g1_i8.p1 TRINITY_DN12332_c0_g1~~TRINITY_DN12332_c0_g1_i8.p1  ORF type:complete len:685 (-),score=81.66 TRINITY_DN12332_c0_g1_i8:87-2069(-)
MIKLFKFVLHILVIIHNSIQQQTDNCIAGNKCTNQLNNTSQDIICDQINIEHLQAAIIGSEAALESLSNPSQLIRSSRTVQLGFSPGGSTDMNTFRRNVEAGFLPIPSDVTDEGLFAQYHFNFNKICKPRCNSAFCATSNIALSADPINNEIMQTYLAMGLDSNMTSDDLKRPTLNLIFLLDISASMNYGFNGENPTDQNQFDFDSKFKVAVDIMSDVVDMLQPHDAVGVIAFESSSELIVPMQQIGISQPGQIKDKIRALEADGRTNLQQAIDLAAEVMQQYEFDLEEELENRIILITDAQPNEGDISVGGLVQRIISLQQSNIHTTVIGVGLDFNTQLADVLTTTRGANYFSVNSRESFRKVLVDDFNYMIYPLVYDLQLQLHEDSQQGWQIQKAYGSGNDYEAIQKDGVLIQIPTLFPSPENESGVRGGLILTALKQIQSDIPLKLKVTYVNRTTLETHEVESQVELPNIGPFKKSDMEECKDYDQEKCGLVVAMPSLCSFPEMQQDCIKSCEGEPCQSTQSREWYDTLGMRKAVVLARYADFLRSWLLDEWEIYVQLGTAWCKGLGEDHERNMDGTCTIMEWLSQDKSIIPTPDQVVRRFSDRWERELRPLVVSDLPLSAFNIFSEYLQQQIKIIGDTALQQELDFLQSMIEMFGK